MRQREFLVRASLEKKDQCKAEILNVCGTLLLSGEGITGNTNMLRTTSNGLEQQGVRKSPHRTTKKSHENQKEITSSISTILRDVLGLVTNIYFEGILVGFCACFFI